MHNYYVKVSDTIDKKGEIVDTCPICMEPFDSCKADAVYPTILPSHDEELRASII